MTRKKQPKKTKKKDKSAVVSRSVFDERRFAEVLYDLNLQVIEVSFDGNCLFRTVSFQIYNTQAQHYDLRQETMNVVEEFREFFQPFVEDDESFEEYVERMRLDGEWGGQLELIAMSKLLRSKFFLHHLDQPTYVLSDEDSSIENEIHVSYHDEVHYNAIRHINDDLTGPSPKLTLTETGKYELGDGQTFSASTTTTTHEPPKSKTKKKNKKDSKNRNKKRKENLKQKQGTNNASAITAIMKETNFKDEAMIEQTLDDMDGDIEATIDFIRELNLGDNDEPDQGAEVDKGQQGTREENIKIL